MLSSNQLNPIIYTHTGYQIKGKTSWWWSVVWALAISLSLFGFQLLGALSDFIGMETPRSLSLALRFGTTAIFLIMFFRIQHTKNNTARYVLMIALAFLTLYGFHLVFKSIYSDYVLRLDRIEYIGYFFTFSFIPFFGAAFNFKKIKFDYLFIILLIVTGLVVAVYLVVLGEDGFRNMRYVPFESVSAINVGYAGLTAATLAAWGLYMRKFSGGIKIFLLLLVISGLMLAIISGQRQVVLSAALTVFLFGVFLSPSKLYQKILKQIGFGLFIGVMVFVVFKDEIFSHAIMRVANTNERVASGSEGRIRLWREAIDIFVSNPVLGGPIELPSIGFYPHNSLLEAFMVTGVLGGTLFFFTLIGIAMLAFRILRSPEFGWISILNYQFTISAMFSGALYNVIWYWVSAGLVIKVYDLLKAQKKIYRSS